MDITTLKALVAQTIEREHQIQKREWDGNRYGKTQTEMWQEASEIVDKEWREAVRVLAQGGDYYGIEW